MNKLRESIKKILPKECNEWYVDQLEQLVEKEKKEVRRRSCSLLLEHIYIGRNLSMSSEQILTEITDRLQKSLDSLGVSPDSEKNKGGI